MSKRDRFQPSLEQVALADALGEALEAMLPLNRLHENDFETPATWKSLSDLGVFSILKSEAQGGAGLGLVEEALVAIELGRRLASPSVVASMAASPFIDDDSAELNVVGAGLISENRTVFQVEQQANHLLVRDQGAARLGAYPVAFEPIEDGNWTVQLAVAKEPLTSSFDLDENQLTRLRVIDAAVLAGVSLTALDMAVSYANFREQFGRPIGSYQAIKHHCANMAVSARCAKDVVAFAAVALQEGDPDGRLLAESALVVSGNAAIQNASLNIQIHGGLGFSAEADPHLLIKRAQLYLAFAGGVDAATERLVRIQTEADLASVLEYQK